MVISQTWDYRIFHSPSNRVEVIQTAVYIGWCAERQMSNRDSKRNKDHQKYARSSIIQFAYSFMERKKFLQPEKSPDAPQNQN